MTNAVKFNTTFFDSGEPKFVGGETYPESEETLRCIARGIAEPVVVDDVSETTDAPKPPKGGKAAKGPAADSTAT